MTRELVLRYAMARHNAALGVTTVHHSPDAAQRNPGGCDLPENSSRIKYELRTSETISKHSFDTRVAAAPWPRLPSYICDISRPSSRSYQKPRFYRRDVSRRNPVSSIYAASISSAAACKHERGAVTAITLFFILAVVSLFLVTTMKMISSTTIDTLEQSDATEMLYLAETALERGAYRLNSTNNCDATITDASPVAFGRGTTQIVSATLGTSCVMKFAGSLTANSLPRVSYIQGTYKSLALPVVNYLETFTYGSQANFNLVWKTLPTYLVQTGGVVSWNSGGWFHAATLGGQTNDSRLQGYSASTLATPVQTGLAGRSGTISLRYQKITQTGVPANRIDLGISLFDNTSGTGQVLWSNVTKASMAAFANVVNLAFTLPPNLTFDEIRITFWLDEQQKRQVTAYVDDITITMPQVGSGWALTDWRQIDN